MQKLIKIVNPDVANQLAASGFSYMKEQINGIDVFVFPDSQALAKMLAGNYSKSDYFRDTRLQF